MIENLFRNPKLFTECKKNNFSRFCVRFRADRYALKTGFSLYKIGGENATFWPKMCSKSAKNGPKHLKFTPKQHFCEHFQKIWAKICSGQKFGQCHSFPPLNPSNSLLYEGKNPFLCEITQTVSTLRNIVIEVWILAWIILISVSKKLPSRFLIFWAVVTLLRGIPSKKGEKISLNKVATARKISKIGKVTFWRHL